MKQQALAYFTDTYLSAIGFFLFFCVFCGSVFWVYRRGSRKHYQSISQLPLSEEDRHESGRKDLF
ncbi:MAG: cbb3-type cytochrome c oxidase subunit 3 [Candidatus Brocadiaceae bacterium]|nr:cbb3-type cytochrome c oxidase subunit 3 [Candidatus Brocadiaceae bacterium]